jgi:phage terminase small subunit
MGAVQVQGAGAMSLNPKQSRFVQEYLIDLNATKAAIRAGYNSKTANQTGPRLLVNVGIAAAIAGAQAERGQRTGITQDRVIQELAHAAFLDIKDLFEDDGSLKLVRDMPETVRRAISGLEVTEIFDRADGDQKTAIGLLKKVKLVDKSGNLELIGKHLGMFKTEVKIENVIPKKIVICKYKDKPEDADK